LNCNAFQINKYCRPTKLKQSQKLANTLILKRFYLKPEKHPHLSEFRKTGKFPSLEGLGVGFLPNVSSFVNFIG